MCAEEWNSRLIPCETSSVSCLGAAGVPRSEDSKIPKRRHCSTEHGCPRILCKRRVDEMVLDLLKRTMKAVDQIGESMMGRG